MPTATAMFTADVARELLDAACEKAGLSSAGAELIRLGENGIFRLPDAVVARVGRAPNNLVATRREVELASWLCAAGVPAGPPARVVDQPVEMHGHPVTFWVEIPGPLSRGSVVDMAAVLRQMHPLRPPAELGVKSLQPFHRLAERIETSPIDEATRANLRAVLVELQDRWTDASLDSSATLHGDAHTSNLVRGSDGRLALIDLETCCIGPAEWDLALTATYATSLGWVSRADYADFVRVYGADVTASPAWPLLRRVRELRMTAWLAQKAGESAETAVEVKHRVACLLDPDLPRRWSRN
jgi:Phosphotransferase enzyme family